MKEELSQGFIDDLTNILEECWENKTDRVSLKLKIEDTTLIVDMKFKVEKTDKDI